MEEFQKINYQYFIRKDLKSKSPLYSALLELEKMIDILDQNSPFYYPLVLIDSGGYIYLSKYSMKHIYGYGLISSNILKEHLKNNIPEIVIILNDGTLYKNIQETTDKNQGIIALNLSTKLLSNLTTMDISDTINNKNILDDLSLRIYIVLFHEILGLKRGRYSSNNDNLLYPNYFYDKNKNKIMKIDFIKSSNIKNSGSFLDYFLGESKYGYISTLIEIMLLNKINLNFIFNANLWNKKIRTLQNYIELKYLVFINNKSLFEKLNFENINDEIKYLEKVIKHNDFKDSKVENNLNIIQNQEIRKRKDDFSEYDDLSIKEIKDRFKDENTSYEEKMFYKRLLSYRTQRK